jgi:hypothetical protein
MFPEVITSGCQQCMGIISVVHGGACGDKPETSAALSVHNDEQRPWKVRCDELEEHLRADKDYQEKRTLRGFMRVCKGPIK